MRVTYKYNNMDLRNYGVRVSKGRGFLGVPARKEPKKYEYPDENGYLPDLIDPVYEARTVTLECFIIADNAIQLSSRYKTLTDILLSVTSLVPFIVEIDAIQVFSGNVYTKSISELNKFFSEGKNVGTFNIEIVEPNPTISLS